MTANKKLTEIAAQKNAEVPKAPPAKKVVPPKPELSPEFLKDLDEVLALEEDAEFFKARKLAKKLKKKWKGMTPEAKKLKVTFKRVSREDRAFTKIWSQRDKLDSKLMYERVKAIKSFRQAGEAGRIYLRKILRTSKNGLFLTALEVLMEKRDGKTQELMLSLWPKITERADKQRALEILKENSGHIVVALLPRLCRVVQGEDDALLQKQLRSLAMAVTQEARERETYVSLYQEIKTNSQKPNPVNAALLAMLRVHGLGDVKSWQAFLKDDEAFDVLETHYRLIQDKASTDTRPWCQCHLAYLAIADTGLIGHWGFDEAGGVRAHDSSPLKNHGLLRGSLRFSSKEFGVVGGSMSFSRIGDAIDLGSSSDYSLQDNFSVSLWVNMTYNNVFGGLFTTMNSGGDGWAIVQNGNRQGKLSFAALAKGKMHYLDADTTSKLHAWNHVVAMVSEGERRLFINGVEQKAKDTAKPGLTPSGLAKIGVFYHDSESHAFRGRIDEIRVYKKALAAREIAALYQIGQ